MDELPAQRWVVYVRERISYDQENIPLEVVASVERGDVFQGYKYRIIEDGQNIKLYKTPMDLRVFILPGVEKVNYMCYHTYIVG
jgi:hypothetical protein